MPGIVGVIAPQSAEAYRHAVSDMLASMRHDPSYTYGMHVVPECNACIGWTAHRDSFAEHASSAAPDGLYLAFSGEDFDRLEASGSSASSRILDDYRRYGTRFLSRLNGIFSGVLLDPNRQRALLFNDRYSAERIYVHFNDSTLFFASEAKALLSVVPTLRVIDEDSVAHLLAYGTPQHNKTLFRRMELLPGASVWTFEVGHLVSKERFFHVSEWENQEKLPASDFSAEFVETARSKFPRFGSANTAVGISTTGGLDSRMIIACLSQHRSNLVCYTYGAADTDTLDIRIARQVADSVGLSHHVLRIGNDFVNNFGNHLDRTVYVTDGCLGALGAHELYFSQLARRLSPIRLTGNFGSELLRSVSTLKPLPLVQELFDPSVRPLVEHCRRSREQGNELTRTVFEEVPGHLYGPMAATRSKLIFRTPFLDNDLVRLAYRAPESARRSAETSLRVIAAGDVNLATIPTDRGQFYGSRSLTKGITRILRELTFKLDYLDKEALPASLSALDAVRGLLIRSRVLGSHKFLPYRLWFKNECAEYIEDVLHSSGVRQQPWWNTKFLQTIAKDHRAGRRNYLLEINAVLTLDAIDRVLLMKTSRRST